MKAKAVLPCTVVLAVLGSWAVQAQEYPRSSYGTAADEVLGEGGDRPAPPPKLPPVQALSDWITYTKPDCCGPLGGGPLATELYLRSGWAIPVEGAFFGKTLETGWMIGIGARELFFNPSLTAAWAVDFGISYTYNHGQRNDIAVLVRGADDSTRLLVTRSLHRTYFNMAVGREWYWSAPANAPGWKLRFGGDLGGRYGTLRADMDELGRRSFFRRGDTIGSLFGAVHSDLEIPWGCCTLLSGVRAEWNYNWSDVFQAQNDADFQDLNLLLTLGVRF